MWIYRMFVGDNMILSLLWRLQASPTFKSLPMATTCRRKRPPKHAAWDPTGSWVDVLLWQLHNSNVVFLVLHCRKLEMLVVSTQCVSLLSGGRALRQWAMPIYMWIKELNSPCSCLPCLPQEGHRGDLWRDVEVARGLRGSAVPNLPKR